MNDVRQRIEKLRQVQGSFAERGAPGFSRIIENLSTGLERELEQLEQVLHRQGPAPVRLDPARPAG